MEDLGGCMYADVIPMFRPPFLHGETMHQRTEEDRQESDDHHVRVNLRVPVMKVEPYRWVDNDSPAPYYL